MPRGTGFLPVIDERHERARAGLAGLLLVALAACEKPQDFEKPHVQIATTDCVYCHEPDYASVTTPLHRDGTKNLYPKTCGACHDTRSFRPAHFDHPFKLDGEHALTACWQCHVGSPPVFAGTPNRCIDCHADAFASSTFPGHESFPETCLDCHATSGWKPATGPHPEAAFPVTGSVHEYPCVDCHDQRRGANGAGNTNCVGCHEGVHQRSVLDSIHQDLGLSEYPTGNAPPNFCLTCHPSGEL
jgi:hypothetical protein